MAEYILSHSAQEINDLLSSIPNKVSQDILNNYYLKTQTYSKTEVNDLLASFSGLEFKIVDNISQVTESKYIYFIPASTSGTDNIYDEYIFIDGNAEYIGSYSSQIDLSNYITSGQLTTALSTYVAKEEGKSLIEDAKIAKLDALPSSVYSQAETQQAINTAIEGVNSAGTRISFVKEYKNGTLEYIGENGVILQDIYSKMLELKELPETEYEEKIYEISDEPIGNNLYLVIDNITISGGIDVFSSINNDHYKFDIIQETATSIPKLKCTCLIANTKNFTAKIKVSYIKYFGEKVSFSIECASEAEANSLELSIPKLKFNKEALISLTMDDSNCSDYSVVHAAICNRPIAGHLNALNQKGYYHANQWEVEDLCSVLYPPVGYPLCITDGCGNDRRFRVESSMWVWISNFNTPANIDKGNVANDWRFNVLLKKDDIIEMYKWGHSTSLHDINPNVYNEDDAKELEKGWIADNLLFQNYFNRGIKMGSQPNGNLLYNDAFQAIPELLGSFWGAGDSHIIPLSDYDLYKRYFRRTFPSDSMDYMTTIDTEMTKSPIDRIYMHWGVHTSGQTVVQALKYIHDNYGKGGNDKIWFTTRDEFYEYWYMRKYAKIIKTVSGTTTNFDIYIPKGQYFYYPELTFITNQNINKLANLDNKIKGFSFNGTNMFNINIDDKLLETTEEYVAKYETDTYVVNGVTYTKSNERKAIEKADALYFANQLRSDLKQPFLLRIDAVENVPLESLSISGGNVTDLLIGETIQLTAVLTPAGTAQTNIEWSVNDKEIATVDSNGLVTCVGAGELRVTVQSLDNPAIHAEKEFLCVASRPITGITISGESNGIVDDTIQLTANLTPSNTTETGILWETDNNTIAEVTQSGLVTLKSVGTVKIIATSLSNELVYDELIITVAAEAIPVESITVKGITPIEVGNTEQFSVIYNPTNTTEVGVVWTSSNQNVATVDSNGWVTAISVGTATIMATSIHRQVVAGTQVVTVTPQVVAVTGLTITGGNSVDSGNTLQLGVSYTPSNTTQQGVTWSSSDETKATVNSNGLVTAIAEGAVVITATSTSNGAISDTHNVTINAVSNLYAVIKTVGAFPPTGVTYGLHDYNGWKYSISRGITTGNPDNVFYWNNGSVAGTIDKCRLTDITEILGEGFVNQDLTAGRTDDLPTDKWYPDVFYNINLVRAANPNPLTSYGATGFKLEGLPAGTYKVKIWDMQNRAAAAGSSYNINGVDIAPISGHRYANSNPDVHGTSDTKPQLIEIEVTIGANDNIYITSYLGAPSAATNQGAAISAIEIEKIG